MITMKRATVQQTAFIYKGELGTRQGLLLKFSETREPSYSLRLLRFNLDHINYGVQGQLIKSFMN
ncbi:hypothetical protein PAECIP111802_07237 [Paenibacillus allorhizosphaerae]|uniref:Uncharacterized protein n=1 Tax=Paenibacillus allorhizosphaerae TaxID=2849866 RepID=A0ABN7U0P8_9BACL|nr:hypothetical protein PAECIP111802_07237 [Paenibacillus allorhizosphaerae]